VKWALIGASDIAATRMIPAMRAVGHDVVGVMSSSEDRGHTYAKANGLPLATTDLGELLDRDCDAVYISTTNQRHAREAVRSARAGKHVLCEKPLAMSIADAQAVIDACRASKVVLGTNHHIRNSAVISRMRDLLHSGAIGELRAVRVHHAVSLPERLRGWRLTDRAAGAGVILDIGVHDADTLRFVTGLEVLSVSAIAASQQLSRDGVEDTAICSLVFHGGAVAMTHESFVTPHAYTALEVHGSGGSIYGRDVLTQDPVGEIRLRRDGIETLVEVPERPDLYQVALNAFARSTTGGGPPSCTGEDGLASLAVALAALASVQQRRPVAVSEILTGSAG